MALVTVQNAKIHIVDQGSGTPTLFLHGVPDSSEVWAPVIDRVQSELRCVAPDLPGFGNSTASEDFDCSLENLAAFVDELVNAIGIRQPLNLVVHDFGAAFGLAWALRHPTKVKQLTILNTLFFFSDYRWHFWARVWRTPVLGEFSWMTMSRWAFTQEMKRGSRKLSVRQIHEVFARIRPATRRMILRLYRATDIKTFPVWEDSLLKLTRQIPAQVLWGARDPYIPRTYADRFGASSVQIFPDSGHWLQVEEAEEVASALLKFFAGKSQ